MITIELGSEITHFEDKGCDLAPRCQDCPLPACRYEMPPRVAGAIIRQRQAQALRARGMTNRQIATVMHIYPRSVQRLLLWTPPPLPVLEGSAR